MHPAGQYSSTTARRCPRAKLFDSKRIKCLILSRDFWLDWWLILPLNENPRKHSIEERKKLRFAALILWVIVSFILCHFFPFVNYERCDDFFFQPRHACSLPPTRKQGNSYEVFVFGWSLFYAEQRFSIKCAVQKPNNREKKRIRMSYPQTSRNEFVLVRFLVCEMRVLIREQHLNRNCGWAKWPK